MKKIDSIQALRGIAVLLVVLAHLFKIEQKYSSSLILPDFFFGGISGVDIFFVISGFIMVTVTHGCFQKPNACAEFLYHRLTRIYPIYWFFAALVFIIWCINPEWVNHGKTGSILYSFLLLPQDLPPLVAVSWSLSNELYFYFVFSLLLAFPERYLMRGILFWGALLLIAGGCITTSSPLLALVLNPLTFEFIAGAIVGIIYYQFRSFPLFNQTFFYSLFLLSLSVLLVNYKLYTDMYRVVPEGVIRFILFGIPATICLYALLQASQKGLVMPAWLIAIGNASYSIYLSHVLVLSALGKLLFRPSFTRFENIIVMMVLVIASILCGQLSYVKIEKPFLGWFKNRLIRMRSVNNSLA